MEAVVPNHHAHHPGFKGREGFAAAKRFLELGADASVGCDLTAVGPGDHVIDIGSGPGVAVREAIRRGATALAVDPAPVMIRVGRVRNDHPDITWRQGTAEQVPSDDASATVVWSMATVHHWQNIDEGLAEIRRVLKSGGRFLATERHLRGDGSDVTDHGWTEAQADAFVAACRGQGFEDVTLTYNEASRGKLLCVLAKRP